MLNKRTNVYSGADRTSVKPLYPPNLDTSQIICFTHGQNHRISGGRVNSRLTSRTLAREKQACNVKRIAQGGAIAFPGRRGPARVSPRVVRTLLPAAAPQRPGKHSGWGLSLEVSETKQLSHWVTMTLIDIRVKDSSCPRSRPLGSHRHPGRSDGSSSGRSSGDRSTEPPAGGVDRQCSASAV